MLNSSLEDIGHIHSSPTATRSGRKPGVIAEEDPDHNPGLSLVDWGRQARTVPLSCQMPSVGGRQGLQSLLEHVAAPALRLKEVRIQEEIKSEKRKECCASKDCTLDKATR